MKSAAEIEKIRHACAVAGRAFARFGEILRPGTTKAELFRGYQRLALEEGADFVPYIAAGNGEWGYGDIIAPADSSEIRAGEVVMLDTGVIVDGYFADFDRNFSFGRLPRQEVRDGFARLVEAAEAPAREAHKRQCLDVEVDESEEGECVGSVGIYNPDLEM